MTSSPNEEPLFHEFGGDTNFNFVRFRGSRSQLVPVTLPNQAGVSRFIISLTGSILISSSFAFKELLAPNSVAFVPANASHQFTIGRGQHDCLVVSFSPESLLALKSNIKNIQSINAFHIDESSSPLGELLQVLKSQLDSEAIQSPNTISLIVSIISLSLTFAKTGSPSQTLADIPNTGQESLLDLLRQVKVSSEQTWALKEAAETAAYSAFHLSRSFRSVTRYGFPEFVDRCRTEQAVKKLLTQDLSFEEISQTCGFGSSHSFRNACREYYGFLPSEIRS